jgi:SAM-dependent methyltransferase
VKTDLVEPYRSQFVRMLECGAGERDTHGVAALDSSSPLQVRPAFVERELDRVSVHLSGLVSLLAAHGVRARRALDVGCSTGGSTASLALSEAIGADQVIGVDPNRLSIDAARVRSRGLGLADKVRYVHIDANAALPFRDRSFDLVLAVSVLEFVPTVSGRERLLAELQRLVRPGGHVYVSTPSRWQLRELHSGRWLGNHRRRSDKPWASGTRFILRQMTECRQIPVVDWLVLRATSRLEPAGRWPPLRTLGGWVCRLAPWQKHLFRRRDDPERN